MTKMTKIQELYDDPKSRGFVNHLIKAYLPVNKTQKLWEFKKDQKHICNICGQKLFDIEGAFASIQNNQGSISKDFIANLRKNINGETTTREENPFVKAIGVDKVQAFTGEKTDTCLCFQCTTDILDLTSSGLLNGDKNINYQLNQMKRDTVFSHFTENSALDNNDKQKVKEIKKRVDKKKSSTFGDLNILQELKKKMELEGKT